MGLDGPQRDILASFYSMQAGSFYRVTWARELAVRQAVRGAVVIKTVIATVKAGIEYDNKASVIAKRDSGELPAINQGLPWGEWLDYPRTIGHKGSLYLRLYPATEANHRTDVSYTFNGLPCTLDQAKALCLAKEFQDRADIDCFTVKLANLRDFVQLIKP